MSNPYKLFETNKSLENEKGVWLEYPGFSVKILRAGGSNKKFQLIGQEKTKPHLKSIQAGIQDESLSQKIMIEVYAESVIVDWKDVTDRDGNALPFSKENVIKLLTDLPDLFEDIQSQARNFTIFRKELEEIEAKN